MGCLPSPDIQVPDFSPTPSVDAGLPAADLKPAVDGAVPSADMAPAVRWMAEGQGVTTDTVRAVWAADAALSQAYAVGQNGLILHRSGGTWQKETAKTTAGNPITSNLYAVAAVTPDIVYAVGDAGVVIRRAAGVWTQEGQELMATTGLFGVTVITGGEVIVVGDGGLVARRQTTGVYIGEDTTGIASANLRAVSGNLLDGLYAVGTGAVIARRVMDKWQLDTFPIDAADKGNYYAVTQSTDGVFVAGEYGRVLRRDTAKWAREATIAPAPPMMPHFYGLYAGTGELFAVGGMGTIQRRDAATKTWSVEPTGVSVNLYGVGGAGTATLTVGEQGTLLRRM